MRMARGCRVILTNEVEIYAKYSENENIKQRHWLNSSNMAVLIYDLQNALIIANARDTVLIGCNVNVHVWQTLKFYAMRLGLFYVDAENSHNFTEADALYSASVLSMRRPDWACDFGIPYAGIWCPLFIVVGQLSKYHGSPIVRGLNVPLFSSKKESVMLYQAMPKHAGLLDYVVLPPSGELLPKYFKDTPIVPLGEEGKRVARHYWGNSFAKKLKVAPHPHWWTSFGSSGDPLEYRLLLEGIAKENHSIVGGF
jgi:hypothetical protein